MPQWLPASLLQEEHWRFAAGGWSNDNIAFAWFLAGRLDRGAVSQALMATAERHEALRTELAQRDDRVVQVIRCREQFPVTWLDLRKSSSRERYRVLRRMRLNASRPFLLPNGPLVRVALLQLSATASIAVWVIHHAVFDGWSRGVLLRDFVLFYDAASGEERSEPSPPTVQFGDYSVWERSLRSRDALEFWLTTLASRPHRAALPRRLQPSRASLVISNHPIIHRAPAPVIGRLASVAQDHGATLAMALGAAAVSTAARYGTDDVLLRVVQANRDRPETREVIGCLIDFLPVRVDLRGALTFTDVLERVRDSWRAAMAHAQPFVVIAEALRTAGTQRMCALFDCGLNFTPYHHERPHTRESANSHPVDVSRLEGLVGRRRVTASPEFAAAIHLEYVLEADEHGAVSGAIAANETALNSATLAEIRYLFWLALTRIAWHPQCALERLPAGLGM